jgi:hypothetical protein
MPLKTLFLNPPSFENFDGGASSRWPATREIESYWYPVWLTYPAGLLEGSRVLDASPHHVSAAAISGWPRRSRRPTPLSASPSSARRLPRTPKRRLTSARRWTSSAAASLITQSSSTRRANRSTRFSASAIRNRTARSSITPTDRRSKTWTRCLGQPKYTSAIWT